LTAAPTHIVQLTTENFKRIRAVRITPSGSLVQISGKNGAGKTSILDSIQAVLCGGSAIPEQPLRRGAKSGQIVADLGDLTVRRTFSAGGNSSLTIEAKDGTRVASPQAVLDKLTSKLIDPIAFMRMPEKAQAETLLKLTGLDFREADQKRAQAYAERTAVNRQIAQARASLGTPVFPADAKPPAPADIRSIVARRDDALAANEANNATNTRHQSAIRRVEDFTENIRQLEAELKAQREQLAEAERNRDAIAKVAAELVWMEVPDVDAEIQAAEELNRKLAAHAAREQRLAQLRTLETQEQALSIAIGRFDEHKAESLQAAKLPVEGLGVTETGVTFKGVPLSQASGAEQLRVSVAMAAALMGSGLRVVLIRDGNVLDSTGMKLLAELAEAHGLQVWMEKVTDGEPIGVVIEDGMVAEQPAETEKAGAVA
jgi:DNA repair exonuclease SbcCD ATPase subunit